MNVAGWELSVTGILMQQSGIWYIARMLTHILNGTCSGLLSAKSSGMLLQSLNIELIS